MGNTYSREHVSLVGGHVGLKNGIVELVFRFVNRWYSYTYIGEGGGSAEDHSLLHLVKSAFFLL